MNTERWMYALEPLEVKADLIMSDIYDWNAPPATRERYWYGAWLKMRLFVKESQNANRS